MFGLGFVTGSAFLGIVMIIRNVFQDQHLGKYYKVEIKSGSNYQSGFIKFTDTGDQNENKYKSYKKSY